MDTTAFLIITVIALALYLIQIYLLSPRETFVIDPNEKEVAYKMFLANIAGHSNQQEDLRTGLKPLLYHEPFENLLAPNTGLIPIGGRGAIQRDFPTFRETSFEVHSSQFGEADPSQVTGLRYMERS